MLTSDELATYTRDGLVVPRVRLADSTLSALKDALATYLPDDHTRTPDFVPDLMASGVGPRFGSLPELLDLVESAIGPNIILWASGLFGKPARIGKETAWHQDGAYWPIRPLATCTIWIALDQSTAENGCLRYIPGSHQSRVLFSHERSDATDLTLNQVLERGVIDPATARDVELEPGQLSIHDVFLVHGSRSNVSKRRRAAVTLRYMPATSHYDHLLAADMHRSRGVPDISRRALHLVRGVDVSRKNDFTIGR